MTETRSQAYCRSLNSKQLPNPGNGQRSTPPSWVGQRAPEHRRCRTGVGARGAGPGPRSVDKAHGTRPDRRSGVLRGNDREVPRGQGEPDRAAIAATRSRGVRTRLLAPGCRTWLDVAAGVGRRRRREYQRPRVGRPRVGGVPGGPVRGAGSAARDQRRRGGDLPTRYGRTEGRRARGTVEWREHRHVVLGGAAATRRARRRDRHGLGGGRWLRAERTQGPGRGG